MSKVTDEESISQQSIILQYLECSYSGAKMMDDLETMVKIARAIEAFNLDTDKDCIIKNIDKR